MKNKIIKIIFIVVAMIFVLATLYFLVFKTRVKIIPVEIAALELNSETVQNKDFSMFAPKGWTEVASTNFMAINPVGVKLSDSESALEYFSAQKEVLSNKAVGDYLDNLKSFLDKTTTKSEFIYPEGGQYINGFPAFYIESDYVLNSVNFKKLTVVLFKDIKTSWLLTYNVSLDDWNKYKDLFYKSVSSFGTK
ncbi:MAG: hypothetical protein PHP03_01385 [Candidatus Pacebacteria bacterium]|nr:hypothetical protein [Candidatus Paceibacterota bacterium]